jgi:hypothetical protein
MNKRLGRDSFFEPIPRREPEAVRICSMLEFFRSCCGWGEAVKGVMSAMDMPGMADGRRKVGTSSNLTFSFDGKGCCEYRLDLFPIIFHESGG